MFKRALEVSYIGSSVDLFTIYFFCSNALQNTSMWRNVVKGFCDPDSLNSLEVAEVKQYSL